MAWSGSSPNRIRGRKGQKLRDTVIARDPLCVACQSKGKVEISTQADHITPLSKGGTNDLSNFQGLCIPCHAAKSAADEGRKLRPTYGVDGWPL